MTTWQVLTRLKQAFIIANRGKYYIVKAENRTSMPQSEVQRVGGWWKPDTGAVAEWAWEPQPEIAL
jgi:hypothetical protein